MSLNGKTGDLNGKAGELDGKTAEGGTDQVIEYVRRLIEAGSVKPGDRLPSERDLAVHVGVSRPTVRAGLRALAAMGAVESRHGSGTYIQNGPPRLGVEPLDMLALLHGFTREDMYEARRLLEVGAASLAAERATPDQIANLADEVTGLFASIQDPQAFLVHDLRFHRAVATAAGNVIVTTLVDLVSKMYYERRKRTAMRATELNLKDAAEMHRQIYQAIRARDPQTAADAMNRHLLQSSSYQAQEERS